MSTLTDIKWNAKLYDDKHAFVFKYGEDLVDMLAPRPGERILDLGCGTGYLSDLIARSGALVTGIDNSEAMIAKAKEAYPEGDFRVMAATAIAFDQPFDAVFSNAVLHWVTEARKAAASMAGCLKTGGRLVLEMGGKDNVEGIVSATRAVLSRYGYHDQAAREVWYFPSLGQYAELLESQGFRITYASHYDRETPLQDSKNGIKDWLGMFGENFFRQIPREDLEPILEDIQTRLRPSHFREGCWWADYKRLRIVAIKQPSK